MFDSIIQWLQGSYNDLIFTYDRFVTTTYSYIADGLPKALWETLVMTVVSSSIALIIGLPLGLLLYCTAKDSLSPNRFLNRTFSFIVDAIRAVPFIILAAYLMKFNQLIIGRGTGIKAVISVLIIMSIPFFARIAEMSFRGVDKGLIEAMRAMGANRLQIIINALIPEALPSLITAMTVTLISIISATSLAGTIGGGGLGDMATRFGIQRYFVEVMTIIIIVLIIMNMSVQWLGDKISKKLDHNKQ